MWIAQPNAVLAHPGLCLSPVSPAGRSATVWARVEGELRSDPDGARGRSGVDRAGPEAGGPAPHALGPFLLEGLQNTQRTSLRTADIVSFPVLFRLTAILSTR